MSCIPLPNVPTPELPFPFTLGGSISISASTPSAELCCKLPPIPIPIPPIPIPPLVLNPAIMAAMKAAITAINAYINSLPLDCPLE